MRALRVLYHMARADVLERTRRYSFLVMLGMVVWLGYAAASGQVLLRVPPNYIGVINPAWVGVLMTLTVTLFLGWLGFYLVKGSVGRDYDTGVGQIMATTPLSRPLYVLGKWLSNFAVLSLMVVILLFAGVVMILLAGTAPLDLWALAAPMLFIALPCMGLVAALAVLFETVSWLRGGFGNLVYFFLFMLLLVPNIESEVYQPWLDYAGFRLIGDSIVGAAKAAYPESQGGFAFSFTSALSDPQYFVFEGLSWTGDMLLARFFFLLAALGLVMLAAVFFDRFNPARLTVKRKRAGQAALTLTLPAPVDIPLPQARLTPLAGSRSGFRFTALYVAELKLLLKGQRWWWYAVALGLVVAQLTGDLEATRISLALAWLWPVLLLSGLGSREKRHNLEQIVFSAPRPVRYQLPAMGMAAFTVLALLGSGAFLKFLLAGQMASLLAWLAGALFIPSLALAFGVLSGSSKAFEVVYLLWMYAILQKVVVLDFVGMTEGSPWQVYGLLGPGLFALAAFVRGRQVNR